MKVSHSVYFTLVVLNLQSGALTKILPQNHERMNMELDMDNTLPQSTDKIIPVPHEPHHSHGIPILDSNLTPAERSYWEGYNTTTFFNTKLGNRALFNWHVVSVLFVTIFLYPICLALYSANSNYYLICLGINYIIVLISTASYFAFEKSFPGRTWYPNNAYRYSCAIVFILSTIHFISYALLSYFDRQSLEFFATNQENVAHTPNEGHDMIHLQDGNSARDGTTLDKNSRTQEYGLSYSEFGTIDEEGNYTLASLNDYSDETLSPDQVTSGIRYHSKFRRFKDIGRRANRMTFFILNVPILLCFGCNLFVGLAVGNLLGKGQRIFNLLAHWIKGGVFLVYGIVTLLRYCGMWSQYGLGWNKKIITYEDLTTSKDSFLSLAPRGMITMEAIELCLISFYGCTNIFLEHLAGAGGAWTAKDLQHVSIAFIYMGAGFCGLLVEVQLNNWRYERSLDGESVPDEVFAGSPGFSPNPFSSFTIFWTGILMSQHAQASEISTSIHTQWGKLLSFGSFFRLFTFLLLYYSPTQAHVAAKPFTELICAFCLICGGLIFMESTDQVIEAIEYRGLTSMFTCNVIIGITTIFMAWIMSLYMLMEYLSSRNNVQ